MLIAQEKNIISPLELQVDCCESITNKINLDKLQLESPLKNTCILMHNDGLLV
jgi:hypothetical protein